MTELASITKNRELVSEEKWKKYISGLENAYEDIDNVSKEILQEKLEKAVEKRAEGKVGVLFSGGLDSSYIAFILKQLKKDFICFSVGLEGSPDLVNAGKVARHLNLRLEKRVVTLGDVEGTIPKVMQIIKSRNVVKIGVGLVAYFGMELAKRHGVHQLFSGLGSEEIFAGYQRHARTESHKELHEECWSGLKQMWERDLMRDYLLAQHFKITLLTPFLDKNVIHAAMNIHPKHKIKGGHKKAILADIAEKGLGKFAWRNKKAAQYGSNVQAALKKIAKRNGFPYIRDYLQSMR